MKEVLRFLRELEENNNREWFEANKQRYLSAKQKVDTLAVNLVEAIRSFDSSIDPLSPRDCTWRIYRDVRFSKDKNPYKTQMGVFVARGGKKSGFSGYYFQIGAKGPGNMLASGNYFCVPQVLKLLREDIVLGEGDFRRTVETADPRMVLDTESSLKKVPAGFPADSPDAEYLKLRNYCLFWAPDDSFVIAPHLVERLADIFKTTKPFLDYTNRAIEYAKEELGVNVLW